MIAMQCYCGVISCTHTFWEKCIPDWNTLFRLSLLVRYRIYLYVYKLIYMVFYANLSFCVCVCVMWRYDMCILEDAYLPANKSCDCRTRLFVHRRWHTHPHTFTRKVHWVSSSVWLHHSQLLSLMVHYTAINWMYIYTKRCIYSCVLLEWLCILTKFYLAHLNCFA